MKDSITSLEDELWREEFNFDFAVLYAHVLLFMFVHVYAM